MFGKTCFYFSLVLETFLIHSRNLLKRKKEKSSYPHSHHRGQAHSNKAGNPTDYDFIFKRYKENILRVEQLVVVKEFITDLSIIFNKGNFRKSHRLRVEGTGVEKWMEISM